MFRDYRNVLGLVLILAGVLLGLQQFGLLTGSTSDAIFAAAFGLAALMLLGIFVTDRGRWWAALAGLVLLGLALSSALDLVAPKLSDIASGPIFLAMIALGFLITYLSDRRMWWAIIPSGVLFSLALVAYFDEVPGKLPFEPAGLLFIGMGITFLLLALVRENGKRLGWGIYPGIPLFIFGLMLAFGSEASWAIIGPLMLIAGGAWIILSSLRKK
jgi:hypothetical protein